MIKTDYKNNASLNPVQSVAFHMAQENVKIQRKYRSSLKKLGCLKKIYPKEFYFPSWVRKNNTNYLKPSLNKVEIEYYKLVKQQKSKYENTITLPERKFFKQLNLHQKKKIYQSIPIGSHIIDLFIPNIRTNLQHPMRIMRGLAIEIDGDVHNYEDKMKKDERKGIELSFIGIGVIHIQNWDFNNPSVDVFTKKHSNLKSLDSRERKRLWRRIMLLTLALRLNNKEFFQLFIEKRENVAGSKNV